MNVEILTTDSFGISPTEEIVDDGLKGSTDFTFNP